MLPISKEHCFLEGPQASPVCPSGYEQHVDEDEHGASVEKYRQRRTAVPGKNLSHCSLNDAYAYTMWAKWFVFKR
jgi:hypothetical protein